MEDTTDRALRYIERERRQIEEEQRQTILELQRQRDAITQLRAEARVNQDRLARPASVPTEQATLNLCRLEDRHTLWTMMTDCRLTLLIKID